MASAGMSLRECASITSSVSGRVVPACGGALSWLVARGAAFAAGERPACLQRVADLGRKNFLEHGVKPLREQVLGFERCGEPLNARPLLRVGHGSSSVGFRGDGHRVVLRRRDGIRCLHGLCSRLAREDLVVHVGQSERELVGSRLPFGHWPRPRMHRHVMIAWWCRTGAAGW